MTEYVFVYGTLKRGFGNNALLSKCRFIGKAQTAKREYVMTSRGIPFVRRVTERDAEAHRGYIEGEIYEVADTVCMDRLDALEGHPNWYERKKVIVVAIEEGHIYEAWMYHNDRELYNFPVAPNEKGILSYGR